MTTPIVFDVETTMRCPIGTHLSNPFWPENEVVLWGVAEADSDAMAVTPHLVVEAGPGFPGFLIGSNIAFDIWYGLKHGLFTKDMLSRTQIWDCQLAEYLLTGQQSKMASLDEMALKRGGTVKDHRVSDMFKAGKGADEVPRNMLEDYLRADLENTKLVFWSQWEEATNKGLLPLIWSQMDARLATIEMIDNGLAVDRTFLTNRAATLRGEVAGLEVVMRANAQMLTGVELDPTKPNDLSLLLFGGTYHYKTNDPVGKYKNGKDKYKWIDRKAEVVGMALRPDPEWMGKNGFYSTADNVIDTLAEQYGAHPVLMQVQDYRDKKKQLTTYFEGIGKLVMPDGKVHHNLNHTITATGRLSSSEPNLQNVTDSKKGDIKKAFVSRWGDDGYIVEADYSQLEMIVLAVLSKDKQLLEDIRSGVDMHQALFRSMHHRLMTKDERKMFKRCAFALVYGAGATGISKQAGISFLEAKHFIIEFYTRYPGVKLWHDEMNALVTTCREYKGDKDKETGLPVGTSTHVSTLSQRRYVFREYPLSDDIKKWKKKEVDFSPTEIKNYPVQGGATGDIVPLVLGKLFRVLRNNPLLKDKCLLINTVHDSVMFDVHKDVLPEALRVIKETMEAAPRYIKEQWDYDFPLKLKVGMSFGPNWMEQTEVDDAPMKEAA